MSWFQLTIFSVFALAIAELSQQHLLQRKRVFNERTSAVITFLFQAVVALPILIIFGYGDELFSLFDDKQILSYILIVDFLASIGMIYYLRSFKVKNISFSTILVSISVVVSTTIGIIFLSESFDVYKVVGILLVLMAIVAVNLNNLNLEKNHLFALIGGALFGVTYSLDKVIVLSLSPIIYIFWSFMFVSFMGFVMGMNTVIKDVKVAKFSDYTPILLSSLGYLAYNLFTFTAYTRGGEVGRVDAINNTQVFIIIFVEYFVFKQKTGIRRKLIASILALIGVVILGNL